MRGLLSGSALAAVFLVAGCGQPSGQGGNATAPSAQTPDQAGWTKDTTAQLRDAIGKRAMHGLDQMPFAVSGTDDAALTQTALSYAGALAHGATDPKKLYDVYTVPRPEPDLRRGLADALRAGKVGDWLNSLAPQDANYKKLGQAYLALRKKPAAPTPAISDAGESIKPGASDPRLPVIARELVVLDYLDQAAATGDRYTPTMVAAVKRMQADYGMEPDGVIGADALGILNMSDVDRARSIAVNMERLRWLERTPPATRIDVNLAAARLSYWRDGKLVNSRKVVVGEPDKETPQLGSPIFRLVANPTWTVPRSVQQKEIAGKGAGYLKANNMSWKDGWIVQASGPKNSLGLVKFDMQNDHAIYLHDTPAKPLFGLVQRQRSHGCVRVDDALGFAEMLATDEGVLDQWHQARATGKETFVKLPRQIPVRMLYQTVLFDDAGEPIVRNDPYGWDDRVGSALGFKAGKALRVKTDEADVGP
ncbi:Murein L,D-transpeptidase YcbB/YkuD [Sphingomonas gellani]|uniref:Murein L,D-transpeptidase YcbB/YkuD n=1 Tax=Sphingomonas gellani TaxID=1166340 RepID=A0A1H8FJX2_9SPHN|nr:L,D-transpeptidase family protein [Sphingomonas gellani]SEN32053.1 Murein L,D-transpeptidase YcbB/YkuD [Sphingomonas gellani]